MRSIVFSCFLFGIVCGCSSSDTVSDTSDASDSSTQTLDSGTNPDSTSTQDSASQSDDSSSDSNTSDAPSSASYRAVLLPYETVGYDAKVAASVGSGWLVGLSPYARTTHPDYVEVWRIQDGKVSAKEKIDTPEKSFISCKDGSLYKLFEVEDIAIGSNGEGVVVVDARCPGEESATFALRHVFYYRNASGVYKPIPMPAQVPELFAFGRTACGSSSCMVTFSRSAHPMDPAGESSFSVIRITPDKAELVLDNKENSDTETYGLPSFGAIPRDKGFFLYWSYAKGANENDEKVAGTVLDGANQQQVNLGQWRALRRYTRNGAPLLLAEDYGLDKPFGLLELDDNNTINNIGTVPSSTVAVSRLGARDVRVQESFDDAKARNRIEVIVGNENVAFPAMAPKGDVMVNDVAVSDNEMLIVGDMMTPGVSGENLHAPLMVLVTQDTTLQSADPLPDEPEPICSEPKDCGKYGFWGVKCYGHFNCKAGMCEPNCDFEMCSNGVCDVDRGETSLSCPSDCLN